jgi:Flp pilus assembly pilin Flp
MFVKSAVLKLIRDTRGVSAVEYGLLISGIGLALFGASEGFSYGNRLIWDLVLNNVNSATGTGSGTSA